jgi:hypothetical protein
VVSRREGGMELKKAGNTKVVEWENETKDGEPRR